MLRPAHWPLGLSRKTVPLAGHHSICRLRPSGAQAFGWHTYLDKREGGARSGILCMKDLALHLARLLGYLGSLGHQSCFPRKMVFLETLPFSWPLMAPLG